MVVIETDLEKVREVKRKHRFTILLKPNVIGVGIGYKLSRVQMRPLKTPCITAIVSPKLPAAQLGDSDSVPPLIDNCLTDVIEVGWAKSTFSPAPTGHCQRIRPVPGGVSGGHYDIGLGTLTGWVKDVETGQPLLESCWHVLTNYGRGRKGDDIIQPAKLDGGRKPKDTVAFLERWIEPVILGPTLGEAKSNMKFLVDSGRAETCLNKVDCALAVPVSEEFVDPHTVGVPKSKRVSHKSRLADDVVMIGRSGVQHGFVLLVDLDILVQEGPRGVALFEESDCTYFPHLRWFAYSNSARNVVDLLHAKPF